MNKWRLPAAIVLRLMIGSGWAGLVGIALVLFALSFEYSGNRAVRHQIDEAETQRHQLRVLAKKPASSLPGAREQLQRFQSKFPDSGTLPDVLLRLHESARKYALAPKRSEYRESSEPGGRLTRVRISMPIKGSYAALRTWLADVLMEMPQLTLDALELSRKNIGENEMDAQVRLTVFLSAGK